MGDGTYQKIENSQCRGPDNHTNIVPSSIGKKVVKDLILKEKTFKIICSGQKSKLVMIHDV